MSHHALDDDFLADLLGPWADGGDVEALASSLHLLEAPVDVPATPETPPTDSESADLAGVEAANSPHSTAIVRSKGGDDEFGASNREERAFSIGRSSSRGGSRASKRRLDPNKARNERMRQIRELRGQVSELTAQLGALKALPTKGPGVKSPPSEGAHAQVSAKLIGGPPLWEAICRNQMARRIQSERENAKLRRALDEHAELARSIQRALKKPATRQDPESFGLRSSKRVYSLPSDSEADTHIFEMLKSEAESAYFEFEEILSLNGIETAGPQPLRGSHMREGARGRFVDMFSSSMVPFGLGTTSEVVWKVYSGPYKHRGPVYYKTTKTSDNTIAEKLAIELFSNNVRGDFRIWQVMRRYVEADYVLVVLMGLIEPIEFASKSFSSCAFREKVYVVCKRDPDPSRASSYTQLLQCYRFIPYTTHASDEELTETDKREIGAVIEFVLGLDVIGKDLERYEDELVRESLGRS